MLAAAREPPPELGQQITIASQWAQRDVARVVEDCFNPPANHHADEPRFGRAMLDPPIQLPEETKRLRKEE